MLDRDRVVGKIEELDIYLGELQQIAPITFDEYRKIEKKRSCERLLQLCIECVIDLCKMIVAGLRLGIPSEENDIFEKLQKKGILTPEIVEILKEMRGFRNILVHEYAIVDDELIYRMVKERLSDFKKIKEIILKGI